MSKAKKITTLTEADYISNFIGVASNGNVIQYTDGFMYRGDVSDLNEFPLKSGIYGLKPNCLNHPAESQNSGDRLIVLGRGSGRIELLIPLIHPRIYRRHVVSGTFTPWKVLTFT